jgi:hypothetical protein
MLFHVCHIRRWGTTHQWSSHKRSVIMDWVRSYTHVWICINKYTTQHTYIWKGVSQSSQESDWRVWPLQLQCCAVQQSLWNVNRFQHKNKVSEPTTLYQSIHLFSKMMNEGQQAITILDTIQCPVFYLRHNISATGFCLHLWVGQRERAIVQQHQQMGKAEACDTWALTFSKINTNVWKQNSHANI